MQQTSNLASECIGLAPAPMMLSRDKNREGKHHVVGNRRGRSVGRPLNQQSGCLVARWISFANRQSPRCWSCDSSDALFWAQYRILLAVPLPCFENWLRLHMHQRWKSEEISLRSHSCSSAPIDQIVFVFRPAKNKRDAGTGSCRMEDGTRGTSTDQSIGLGQKQPRRYYFDIIVQCTCVCQISTRHDSSCAMLLISNAPRCLQNYAYCTVQLQPTPSKSYHVVDQSSPFIPQKSVPSQRSMNMNNCQ